MIDPYSAVPGTLPGVAVRGLAPGLVGDPVVDPLVVQVRAALERQSFALLAVRRRVEDAATRIPPVAEAGWTGAAHTLYEVGLTEMERAVDRAREAVAEALAATDLALDSLARHGG